jgi:hypothetical protein
VPSPFKTSLFWPEVKADSKSKNKEKLPAVATSEQWRNYHMKKIDEKQKEIDDKRKRQEIRLQKRKIKEEEVKEAKNKKENVKKLKKQERKKN